MFPREGSIEEPLSIVKFRSRKSVRCIQMLFARVERVVGEESGNRNHSAHLLVSFRAEVSNW